MYVMLSSHEQAFGSVIEYFMEIQTPNPPIPLSHLHLYVQREVLYIIKINMATAAQWHKTYHVQNLMKQHQVHFTIPSW